MRREHEVGPASGRSRVEGRDHDAPARRWDREFPLHTVLREDGSAAPGEGLLADAALREAGLGLGFRYVASGPLVRSSYRAAELFLRGELASRAPEAR